MGSLEEPPASARGQPAARRAGSSWLSVLSIAVIAASIGFVWLSRIWVVPVDVGPSVDGGPSQAAAQALRSSAWEEYRRGRFAECLKDLDAARELRPGREPRNIEALRKDVMGVLGRDGGS